MDATAEAVRKLAHGGGSGDGNGGGCDGGGSGCVGSGGSGGQRQRLHKTEVWLMDFKR